MHDRNYNVKPEANKNVSGSTLYYNISVPYLDRKS